MTVTATTVAPMTAEEFDAWADWPENAGRHFERVRGEVVETSRPGEEAGQQT